MVQIVNDEATFAPAMARVTGVQRVPAFALEPNPVRTHGLPLPFRDLITSRLKKPPKGYRIPPGGAVSVPSDDSNSWLGSDPVDVRSSCEVINSIAIRHNGWLASVIDPSWNPLV